MADENAAIGEWIGLGLGENAEDVQRGPEGADTASAGVGDDENLGVVGEEAMRATPGDLGAVAFGLRLIRRRDDDHVEGGRSPTTDGSGGRLRALLPDLSGKITGGPPHLILSLEILPEVGRGAEVVRETHGGIGGDAPAPQDNLVDPAQGHLDLLRETILRQTTRLEEFLEQNLTGMNGFHRGGLSFK